MMPSTQSATALLVLPAQKRANVLQTTGTQMRSPVQLKNLHEQKKKMSEELAARVVPNIIVTPASPS